MISPTQPLDASADCIFCKIACQQIPAPLLHSDESCVAFRDIHPQAPTHLLVIPRRHVCDLPALALEQPALLGHLLQVANHVASQQGIAQTGFRVVINTGEHGGQSVFHLHLHVLGGRPLAWPPG